MNIAPMTTMYLNQELVHERIRTLHREAEQERLAGRVRSVEKARREVERASRRLRSALARV
ncbi:hypothetical protein [Microbispora triticiradicis]|uniref:Uncharacterized protein n=2 Tax=Streptosporangiaceae TaxID=2004 RepID=A0ABX9LQQ3_9ACTN|nr:MULTISPECIES: hypothetical protein [Microbispora]RGA06307.1 hypothetical protein DI270_003990 [Microbispora triticiradicis]GLW26661.1 hypothetical protein Mame01_67030 [Microbispora amethystogenes]